MEKEGGWKGRVGEGRRRMDRTKGQRRRLGTGEGKRWGGKEKDRR